jgi:hypothetical protein
MSLLLEVTGGAPGPVTPEGGWNVGHLAHHGILLTCDSFTLKLDLDQLNALFDLAEDGTDGEIRDHDNKVVYIEIGDSTISLSRDGDKSYPGGVTIDADTLKEMGIEAHEAAEAQQPTIDNANPEDDGIIDSAAETAASVSTDKEVSEGVKRAFRKAGKKIKPGFRVTSGWRKGRVMSSAASASKPRPKAKTRMKLRLAAKKKRIIRILKGKITRRKPLSKRLVAMNKRKK